MAYDEYFGERIEKVLEDKGIPFEAKKMMGGLCFMVDAKMCMGIHFDKKRQEDLLMARVGIEAYEGSLNEAGALPMDITGRVMKGFVFVTGEGWGEDADLEKWIDRCLAYNPEAPRSQKKSVKKKV